MKENFKILIIDDEASIRDSCSQVLSKEGYVTETAEDGSIGLEKVRKAKPDLVLVDLKMPGISGMEVLESLKELDPDIVSIVITGYATIESAVEAMKLGAYDYIPKPFTPDELRLITRRGLEKRRLLLETATLRQEKKQMEENFISLVTHELRSPLIAVKQYFDVILDEEISGRLKNKQKEMLGRASQRIDGLMKLVNDWLQMMGIKEDEIAKRSQDFDLKPLLKEAVELLKPLADTSEVALQLKPIDDIPRAHGDKLTIIHIFLNILGNGIKYNRKGGKVTVSVREDGELLAVDVADTGMGIPEESLPLIFDQFYRVRGKGTRKLIGTGLGLSIARRIVEAHKGQIKVQSTLGQGSTFTVLLPRAPQHKKQKSKKRP
ncbi:MAG: response regulator [Acidobacteriota bacterium]